MPASARLGLAGLLALLMGCSEYSYTSEVQIDTFQQVRRNTVDILMVVDNSCSMAEEQDKLAANFPAFIEVFDGVDVDWQIAVTTTDILDENQSGHLLGGDDEVELLDAEGRTIDRFGWDLTWPNTTGASIQVDPAMDAATDNDSVGAWCLSSSAFGDGDLGSPGLPNEACVGATAEVPPAEEPDASTARPATSGEVLVNEVHNDPEAVADALGEWVELRNLTADTLDLSGYALADEGRNLATLPDGTLIGPNGFLVIGRSMEPGENGGASVDLVPDGLFTLNNAVKILSPEIEGAEEIFSEMVAVGVTGSGIEAGLEGAYLALSEPLLSGDNAGFLREAANLAIIILSDENDYSGRPVDEYLMYWKGLKGDAAWRDNSVVNLSAVVGSEPPAYEGEPSCQSSTGLAAFGLRYVDLAARTDGSIESICDDDFTPIAAELGLTASGLQVEFALSQLPIEESIVVQHFETNDQRSLIGDLELGVDCTYDPDKNAIVFRPDQVLPSETWLVVEYKVAANGSTRVDEESAE